jgi:hypothetical protein
LSGFAIFSDDPIEAGVDHSLAGTDKVLTLSNPGKAFIDPLYRYCNSRPKKRTSKPVLLMGTA